jgi:hypothetical protein
LTQLTDSTCRFQNVLLETDNGESGYGASNDQLLSDNESDSLGRVADPTDRPRQLPRQLFSSSTADRPYVGQTASPLSASQRARCERSASASVPASRPELRQQSRTLLDGLSAQISLDRTVVLSMVEVIEDTLREKPNGRKRKPNGRNRKPNGRKLWKKQRPRKESDLLAYWILNLRVRPLI